ncbi:hypothetical protein JM18_007738 [Phytophthora kernoviae]|uniref:C2H2-type domain-containing protein n=1 Tax=Phytophthora kernoviae TaxID=325452 RepID=A0A8T0LPN8_9STRA|nr:hypothetical protein JM16_007799 [Phytophthora kernoviae]KAG2518295.1 hypothetical protein JM18_007738 [Phytophthora kernoviae]
MLRDLFLAYYQSTSRKPEHVIYYRDGVSEGQFYDILQTEMRALRKAFKMISDDYNAPVTFIIVNKRHHMRAFPVNQRDGDRKGNVVPGTVIDTGIVDSHRYDFFLYGHSGIQGTSVPCHYTVLHDENKMSAEDVQKLTEGNTEQDGAAPTQVVYRCSVPYCDRSFTDSFSLAEHLKMHAGEKRHICPVRTCARRFSTPGNLSRHKRLHGPIKPLECPVTGCICTFRSENKLSKHMKFHLGSPVHVCPSPACGKTFSTAGNLNRHIKGHHPDLDTRKIKLLAVSQKPVQASDHAYDSPTGADEALGSHTTGSPVPYLSGAMSPTSTMSVSDAGTSSPASSSCDTPVASPMPGALPSLTPLDIALDPEQLDALVSILDETMKPESEGLDVMNDDCFIGVQPIAPIELATEVNRQPVSVLDDMIQFHIESLQM